MAPAHEPDSAVVERLQRGAAPSARDLPSARDARLRRAGRREDVSAAASRPAPRAELSHRSRSRGRADHARAPRVRDDSRPRRLRRGRHVLDDAHGAHAIARSAATRCRSFRRRARATDTISPRPACARRAPPAQSSSSRATAARARIGPIADAAGRGHRRHRHRPPPAGRAAAARVRGAQSASAPGCTSSDKELAGSWRRVQARARAHARRRRQREHCSTECSTSSRSRRSPTSRLCAARTACSCATGSDCSTRRERPGIRAMIRAAGLDRKAAHGGPRRVHARSATQRGRPTWARAPRRRAADGAERAGGESHRARARGAQRAPAGDRSRRRSRRRASSCSRWISRRRTASCSPNRDGIPA